jgi:hypothetical protein
MHEDSFIQNTFWNCPKFESAQSEQTEQIISLNENEGNKIYLVSNNFEQANKNEDLMFSVSHGWSISGCQCHGLSKEKNEINYTQNFWELFEDLNLNETKQKDICLESALVKKVNKCREKSEERENNVLIELSPAENDKLNSSNTNHESNAGLNDNSESYNITKENKFLNKKRKFIEENPFIFIPTENNNDLRKLINEIKNNIIKNDKIKMYFSKNNFDDVFNQKKGKKKKNITCRKENTDNINKKIKTRFLKLLKEFMNKKLKAAGCKKRFKYIQQTCASKTNKDFNREMLSMKLKDFFTKNILVSMNVKNIKETDLTNYEYNKKVYEHLIKNNYNFNFLDKTFIELFDEYLNSKQFEEEIDNLRNNNKEKLEYIKNYIIKAIIFRNHYCKDVFHL